MDLTSETLITLAGSVLALLFAYFPWFKDWFDALDPRWKPLLNAGILLVVDAGYLLYSCRLDWACVSTNLEQALVTFFAAIAANQLTYLVGVRQFKRREFYMDMDA